MCNLKVNAQNKQTFSIGKGTFLLNEEPVVIKAAEMHYPRIPEHYWEHRIRMCKALGMIRYVSMFSGICMNNDRISLILREIKT